MATKTFIVLDPPVGVVRVSDAQARYLRALLRKDDAGIAETSQRTLESTVRWKWVENFHVGWKSGHRLTKNGRGIAKVLEKEGWPE